MKNFLDPIALLAVIIGGISVGYYYGYYLPQKDVQVHQQAVQRANPTPEQQAAQKEANIRAMKAQDTKMKAYGDCLTEMGIAMGTHTQSTCGTFDGDYIKWSKCSSEAQKTFVYEDCRERLF